uniref:Transcription elongation factor n=1 Tax=Felis catus TaxID=9685 RepID=A0ABI7WQW0_FELCA
MDLLRELKAMPVTLHLLQVGPCVPPARDSSWAPGRASWPMPWALVGTGVCPRRDQSLPLLLRKTKGNPKITHPVPCRGSWVPHGTVTLGKAVHLTSWSPPPALWEPRRVCEKGLTAAPQPRLLALQSTRVGMSVNALRKQSSDEGVIALAKSLIKSWKKLLDASDAKAREQRRGGPLPASSSKESPEAQDPSRKRPELPRMPSAPRITTFPPVPVTCDAVRNKCRELLTAALQTDHDHMAVGADCEGLSAQIEECIFRDVGNTDMKYKNRVRSRISNLKDAKNPDLRRNVLCGAITPQQIAVMTSEEMASDELKEIRKAMTKEAIREHQMARTGGTQTDLFTCGKCKKKNCTYTQVQTRSSDEPMTTFVVCNECGNRWKLI